MTVHGDERGRSEQPGIVSRHCFSTGAYYDPDRISLGPLIGVDEHLVEPGAGFDWHRHRGVHIASWVLAGTLRHEGEAGDVEFVTPGALFVQSTGSGIRHTETNPSATEPLRFLQITALGDEEFAPRSRPVPVSVGDVVVDVGPAVPVSGPVFVLVLAGTYTDEGVDRYGPGASWTLAADEERFFDGSADAQALVVELIT